MALRLQTSAPELTDLRSESKATLALYGCDPGKPSFARACLLARRMVERGVRFVNIYHEGWDAHSDVAGNVRNNCRATDQGTGGLGAGPEAARPLGEHVGDLGRRVRPHADGRVQRRLGPRLGRDHHPSAFTIWMAGGGVKRGLTYGATDDLGFHILDNPVHVYDVQATILHLLGFDHEKLTFRHAGRDFRLTDVHGKVVKDILA